MSWQRLFENPVGRKLSSGLATKADRQAFIQEWAAQFGWESAATKLRDWHARRGISAAELRDLEDFIERFRRAPARLLPTSEQQRASMPGRRRLGENPALRDNPVYRVKVHTGPTQVAHYAQRLRKLRSFKNVTEGTEHVYGDISILTTDFTRTKEKLVMAVAWALFNSTSVTARRGISVSQLR